MQYDASGAYANPAADLPMQQQQQRQLPPALEYLRQLDQILVKQKKEVIEMMTDWEGANKYVVLNNMGQQLFFAKEKSGTFERQCYGSMRAFQMEVYDSSEQEVIHISRPFKCMCVDQSFSCMDCCMDCVTVEAPPGQLVGTVKQIRSDWKVKLEIRDASEQLVLMIHGPNYCRCHCPGDEIPFTVMTADGTQEIGRVSKQWSNLLQEHFTDADNFGITFPMDLSLDIKATILGACFLIDFMFFESSDK